MRSASGEGRRELARLIDSGGPSRRMLRKRIELFVAIGAGLGALHLVAGRSGGDHIALTAMLAALVPVFGPVCFIPVVFQSRDRGHADPRVIGVRLSVVAVLGATIAGVHLLVWEVLAAATGSIAGPTVGDIPFSAAVVVATTVVAAAAYQIPIHKRWAQPVTVATLVIVYVVSFGLHGILLTPTLTQVRHQFGAGPLGIEVVATLLALGTIGMLMRREVRDGTRQAAKVPASSAHPLPIEQATHPGDDRALAQLQRALRSTRHPHHAQKQ